jgi:hypothetical protein
LVTITRKLLDALIRIKPIDGSHSTADRTGSFGALRKIGQPSRQPYGVERTHGVNRGRLLPIASWSAKRDDVLIAIAPRASNPFIPAPYSRGHDCSIMARAVTVASNAALTMMSTPAAGMIARAGVSSSARHAATASCLDSPLTRNIACRVRLSLAALNDTRSRGGLGASNTANASGDPGFVPRT